MAEFRTMEGFSNCLQEETEQLNAAHDNKVNFHFPSSSQISSRLQSLQA